MKAIREFSFVNLKTKAAFSRVPKNCCIENNQNLIKYNIQVRSYDKNFRPTSCCILEYNSKSIYSSGSQPLISHEPLSNNYQAYEPLHFYNRP